VTARPRRPRRGAADAAESPDATVATRGSSRLPYKPSRRPVGLPGKLGPVTYPLGCVPSQGHGGVTAPPEHTCKMVGSPSPF